MSDANESLFDVKFELNDALQQRLRPFLNIRNFLALFALLFFLVAWNRGIPLIYGLSALMLSILMVSYLAPYLSLRGVVVTRDKYLVAAVGETLRVTINLDGSGNRWCRMIELVDHVPCANEDERSPSLYVPRLTQAISTHYAVTMNWRGLHTLGPSELCSSYPLGVNRIGRVVESSEAKVLVHPSPFPIAQIELNRAATQNTQGSFLSPKKGGYDEFTSLREFRPGDSPRHIHWAKSSHGQDFQVREYESQQTNVLSIVLDRSIGNNIGDGRYSTFEYQVNVAVSIARYCIDTGITVALHAGKQSVTIPACDEYQYQKIVESLALVTVKEKNNETIPYPHYAQALIEDQPQGCWVLFANDEGSGLEDLNYHSFLSQVLIIEFNSRSFRRPLSTPGAKSSTGLGDYYISRNDNLEKVFGR
jgi:uncharacterized protein (DUF58 family)